jgi:hypothetical protein
LVLQPRTWRRAVPATQALQSWLQGLSRPQASQHFNHLFSWNAPPHPYIVLLVRGGDSRFLGFWFSNEINLRDLIRSVVGRNDLFRF